jgi:hypothetical protein
MRQEGDVIPLFSLAAIPFVPPRPDEGAVDMSELPLVNVLLVNVSEPCLYRDTEAKMGFVLLPGYSPETTFTYEQFQDVHPLKGAWCYRLAPSYWEEGDSDSYDLDEAIYRFDHGEVVTWKEIGD